jgi:2-succinyl-6-hydroxy-2,4-cyclohexadiene-1-carboxylate synthase
MVAAVPCTFSFVETPHGRLHVREYGGAGAPLVALHGFTLHGGMFADLAAALDRTLLAPDLPGHGKTEVAPITMPTAVAALAAWMETLPGPVPLLGYSQGGRIALQLLLGHVELVERLVLISTSPGLPEPDRRARLSQDALLAAHIEAVGLDVFLDAWLSHPRLKAQGISDEARRRDRELRHENNAAGLAAALRGLGQGTIRYAGDGLTALGTPVRFVAGERDHDYADLAADMAALVGGEPIVIPGAGHNVVLEAPEALAAALAPFLDGD